MKQELIAAIENLVFSLRKPLLLLFAGLTLVMGFFALQLRVDAGFEKQIPLEHDYMRTFMEHQADFGGANRILIALHSTSGTIFEPQFMADLKRLTSEIDRIRGVDPSRKSSIFTPDVRFIEIVAGGFQGGQVIPAEFVPETATEEEFDLIRENIIKSGTVGRLVSSDFSAAILSVQLLERDTLTGERLDYIAVANDLERLRAEFDTSMAAEIRIGADVHIIGFAQIVGDIANGAAGVVMFFGIAVLITALLVYLYSHSLQLTVLPLLCSLVAVVWQLGLLVLLGFGLDPLSILVPFLVMAIGVSHGVQMINAVAGNIAHGEIGETAARHAFRRLLIPGGVALLSDTIGFLTILFIQIRMIQELAITASLGVAVIIITNLLLLPLLLCSVRLDERFIERRRRAQQQRDKLWTLLSKVTYKGVAYPIVAIAMVLFLWGVNESRNLAIGDLHAGVPELRPDSRYNQDSLAITEKFDIGVDILQVISEAPDSACISYPVVDYIDRFEWYMANVEGVQSTISLPVVMRIAGAGWNEGNLRWRILSRNRNLLQQASNDVDPRTGLLDLDCKIMPVVLFTEDHKATTIDRIIAAYEDFLAENPLPNGPRYPKWIQFQEDDPFTAPYNAWLASGDEEGAFVISGEVPPMNAAMAAHWDFTADMTSEDMREVLLEKLVPWHQENPQDLLALRLATGNVGVAAATNQVVQAAQFPILLWVYAAIILLCLLTFRSVRATLCTVLPLTLVSVLCYALMTKLEIGLKVSTLPVAALGVGIGVDYGIYIFSRLKNYLAEGMALDEAYRCTLGETGSAVIFTGLTLAIGVSTWFFSALKFQADMGILLTFMFLVNMLGAIFLLPALAAIFYSKQAVK